MGHYAWQCVKVNLVSLPAQASTPPVMKQGKVGDRPHLWLMDSGADICFIAEDLLPPEYMDGPPVYAKGALHPDGKCCPTAIFPAEIDGKRTTMQAAVVARSELPYPAIVGRDRSGLHIVWHATVSEKDSLECPAQTTLSQDTVQIHQSPSRSEQTKTPLPACQDKEQEPHSSCSKATFTQSDETQQSRPLGRISNLQSAEIDLDNLDPVQLLAVRTRAQRKREQLLRQQDQESTDASGAEIHSLEHGGNKTADRPESEPAIVPIADTQPASNPLPVDVREEDQMENQLVVKLSSLIRSPGEGTEGRQDPCSLIQGCREWQPRLCHPG